MLELVLFSFTYVQSVLMAIRREVKKIFSKLYRREETSQSIASTGIMLVLGKTIRK